MVVVVVVVILYTMVVVCLAYFSGTPQLSVGNMVRTLRSNSLI